MCGDRIGCFVSSCEPDGSFSVQQCHPRPLVRSPSATCNEYDEVFILVRNVLSQAIAGVCIAMVPKLQVQIQLHSLLQHWTVQVCY